MGRRALLGFGYDWDPDWFLTRVVENEVKKLDSAGKCEVAKTLMEQADKDEAKEPAKA